MKNSLIASVFISVVLLAALPARGAALTSEQQAVHVLNRLGYGPKPGDIARVMEQGVQRYIDSQLYPEALAYSATLSERLAALDSPNRPAGEVVGMVVVLQK